MSETGRKLRPAVGRLPDAAGGRADEDDVGVRRVDGERRDPPGHLAPRRSRARPPGPERPPREAVREGARGGARVGAGEAAGRGTREERIGRHLARLPERVQAASRRDGALGIAAEHRVPLGPRAREIAAAGRAVALFGGEARRRLENREGDGEGARKGTAGERHAGPPHRTISKRGGRFDIPRRPLRLRACGSGSSGGARRRFRERAMRRAPPAAPDGRLGPEPPPPPTSNRPGVTVHAATAVAAIDRPAARPGPSKARAGGRDAARPRARVGRGRSLGRGARRRRRGAGRRARPAARDGGALRRRARGCEGRAPAHPARRAHRAGSCRASPARGSSRGRPRTPSSASARPPRPAGPSSGSGASRSSPAS